MSEQAKNSKAFLLLATICGLVVFYIVNNITPVGGLVEMSVVVSVFGTIFFTLLSFTTKKAALALSLGIIFLLTLNRLGSLDLLTFVLSLLIVIGIFLV